MKLIPIKGVPDDVEVLYPSWHHNGGTDDKRLGMPSAYFEGDGRQRMGIKSDWIWHWVIHPMLRLECTDKRRTKTEVMLRDKYGDKFRHGYRPAKFDHKKHVSPIRIFGGRKWKWYWLIK